MVHKIKGTQDFLDLSLLNFTIATIKKHLQRYHFHEIATPILEPTDLFVRSLGQATDVVSKEMFLIKTIKDDDSICLRPEATASTVRAFIENGIQQIPWKVFSWGPMFRYERPQKGRFRQFHQVSIEVIGTESVSADVQLITMLDRLFHEAFKLNNYALLINYLGTIEDRATYRAVLKKFLESNKAEKICDTCRERKEKNILRIFDCKNPVCQEIYTKAPVITDHLSPESQVEWLELQNQLELLSVSFVVKPTLVRGLDYYSKTVFEFVSQNLGAQNAFCAGGRYDQLVKELGGKQDMPSIGAALGIERLLLLLEPIRDRLPIEHPPMLHVIVPLSEQQHVLGLLLADTLRAHGLCADVLLDGGSVKSMMRKANKLGAAFVLIVGDDEQATGQVTLKNMMTGHELTMAQSEVADYLS